MRGIQHCAQLKEELDEVNGRMASLTEVLFDVVNVTTYTDHDLFG
jgi:hypothetical protein